MTSADASPVRSPSPQNGNAHDEEIEETKLKGKARDDSADSTQNENEDENGSDGDSSEEEPQSEETSAQGSSQVPSAGHWQAIWSPGHNAYYFYNAATQETTWSNPLQTPADTSATPGDPTSTTTEPSSASEPSSGDIPTASGSLASMYQLQEAAVAQGIDPSLAYLDPSLVAGPSSSGAGFEHSAKFNARTGTFAKSDARDPTHLSEYERAKRMSQFYFDVNAWEAEVAERKQQEEAEGKKRKRPSKKDLVRILLLHVFPLGMVTDTWTCRRDIRSRNDRKRLLKLRGSVHRHLLTHWDALAVDIYTHRLCLREMPIDYCTLSNRLLLELVLLAMSPCNCPFTYVT